MGKHLAAVLSQVYCLSADVVINQVPNAKVEDIINHGDTVTKPLCKDVLGPVQLHDMMQQSLLSLMVQSKFLERNIETALSRYKTAPETGISPSTLRKLCLQGSQVSTQPQKSRSTSDSLYQHKDDNTQIGMAGVSSIRPNTTGDQLNVRANQNVSEIHYHEPLPRESSLESDLLGDTGSLSAYYGDNESGNENDDTRDATKKNKSRSRSKRHKTDGTMSKAIGAGLSDLAAKRVKVPFLKEMAYTAFDEKKGCSDPSRRLELVYRRNRGADGFNRSHREKLVIATALIDTLSRNNNHPGNIDEGEPKNQSKVPVVTNKLSSDDTSADGIFRFVGADVKKSDIKTRPLSTLTEKKNVVIKKRKDYVLVPIGGTFGTAGSAKINTKWTDVASIINQGTYEHRNLNSQQRARVDPHKTLDTGMVTYVMSRLKLYAVKPIKKQMTGLKHLLAVNAESRMFAETHAKFVCVNLMMALRFLHEHDIMHGSISPKKILFTEKGYPYLTGFGAACIIDERMSRPREMWPLEYSSPEQLYQAYLTEVTDVFSVGALVYAMIYGSPPHKGEDPASTRRNILDYQFVPPFEPENITAAGKKFILKCIRKNERRRFSILDQKKGLFDSVPWFAGLNEDRLYRQLIASPMIGSIKKYSPKSEH